jgi:hypothetical protein
MTLPTDALISKLLGVPLGLALTVGIFASVVAYITIGPIKHLDKL